MALQTIEQFGQSVKAKYPQYQNIPDAELGAKTLEKYPVYKSKVAPIAPPPMSVNRTADQESAQKYGAFLPAKTTNASPIAEALKTAVNIPKSAFNFVKGMADVFNPVSTVDKIKQAGVETGGLMQDIAGVKKSNQQGADLTKQLVTQYQTKKAAGQDVSHLEDYFKTNKIDVNQVMTPKPAGAFSQFPSLAAGKEVAKVLPKTAYETFVPEGARGLATGVGGMITGNADKEKAGFDTAHRAIVNDPVGTILPFIFAGKGAAKIADKVATKNQMGNYVKNIDTNIQNRVPIPTKPVTKYSTGFDTAISKTAAPVIKATSKVFGGARDLVTGGAKFATGQATGLQPETISQVIEKPGAFTKEARASVDRASLGQEVQSALGKKSAVLSETGAGYEPIRTGGAKVKVAPNWIDSTITDLTGLKVKKGQLQTSGSAVLREAQDVRAMQHLYDLWKPIFKKGEMTSNEFLNFRADLAKISKFERQIGKSQPLESMAKIARGRFNESYRPQLSGLDKLDAEFSAQNAELAKLSKGFVDRNGNLTDAAINRIANATGKGKDLLLSRLEETVPGITQKIKVLKAVEDIQNASGIKVGTYGRAAITGGAFFAGGPVTAAITAILTSPELAVPILRRYGLIKNSAAVQAVIKGLKTGAKTINELPNNPPAILNKDVREIKAPAGLSIEDVSGGKPSAFSPKAPGVETAPTESTGKIRFTKNADKSITVHLLEADVKNKGFGTNAIKKLFKENPTTQIINGATDQVAIGFWKKMGAKFAENKGEHGEVKFGLYKEDFNKAISSKPTGAFSAKPANDLVKLGVDPKNIISVKQFGSSVEGKAKPNDYDHFITVKDGSMKFKKQGSLPVPIIKDIGKNQYFIMPESEAQAMIDAMLYTGRKDQVRFHSGRAVDVTKLFTGSKAKRTHLTDNSPDMPTGFIKTGKTTGVFIPEYKPKR